MLAQPYVVIVFFGREKNGVRLLGLFDQFKLKQIDADYRIELSVVIGAFQLTGIAFSPVVERPPNEAFIADSLDFDIVDFAVLILCLDVKDTLFCSEVFAEFKGVEDFHRSDRKKTAVAKHRIDLLKAFWFPDIARQCRRCSSTL